MDIILGSGKMWILKILCHFFGLADKLIVKVFFSCSPYMFLVQKINSVS